VGNDENSTKISGSKTIWFYKRAGMQMATPVIDVDWFVYDVERQIKSNDSILLLRNLPSVPGD
jgi:hypothetical protein